MMTTPRPVKYCRNNNAERGFYGLGIEESSDPAAEPTFPGMIEKWVKTCPFAGRDIYVIRDGKVVQAQFNACDVNAAGTVLLDVTYNTDYGKRSSVTKYSPIDPKRGVYSSREAAEFAKRLLKGQ